MAKVTPLTRVFRFNGKELPDIDPKLPPEGIMELYSKQYPSLTSGEISGPEYGEEGQEEWKLHGKTARYNMSGGYGTKG